MMLAFSVRLQIEVSLVFDGLGDHQIKESVHNWEESFPLHNTIGHYKIPNNGARLRKS